MSKCELLTETGQVTQFDGKSLWVATIQQSTCGGCKARFGCGQKLLHQLTGDSPEIKVNLGEISQEQVRPGDSVEIGLDPNAVVLASLNVYLLPLITMILFLVGFQFIDSEVVAFFSAATGLVVGFWLSKSMLWRYFAPAVFEPVLVRVHPKQDFEIVDLQI